MNKLKRMDLVEEYRILFTPKQGFI